MTEAEWMAATDPAPMFAAVKGRKNERKLRLFAVACCRRISQLGEDEQAQKALAVAELLADGLAVKPQRRNAARSVSFGPGRWTVVAFALSKVAFEAASRSSHVAAGMVAQTAVQHFPEPATTLDIHRQAAIRRAERTEELSAQASLLRDVFGNPFRPAAFSPAWRTDTAVALAKHMYESRDFSAMPIMGDALQDAGCDDSDILSHCRDPQQVHVRGCWVLDGLLGRD